MRLVPQAFSDEGGHICPKVKQSLVSLNTVDFKMPPPQVLAAIWPEMGHDILNGSWSSWIIHMPSSPVKLRNLLNWGVLFPSQPGRCLQPSLLCPSAVGLWHYIHLQLWSSSRVATSVGPASDVSLFLIWAAIFTHLPIPVCAAASVSVH